MKRRAVLWGFPAILLMTFCSLSDLDYLRSEIGAADGAADIDAGIDAESGARDAIVESELAAPPCGADGGYRELVLCDQPAAYWRLGDLGPPSAINQADSGSAAAYIAADAGSITYGVAGAIAGDPDHAIHLDGTGLVNGGTALSFPGRAPYSIEAWVAPEGDNFSYRRIVEQVTYDSNGNAQDGYIIYNHETSAAEQYVDGSAAQVLGPPLGNLAYSHVVVTFDGGALRIYVNGALARTTAATAVPAAAVPATVFIGGNTRPGSGWIGKIDEVAIYAYPLDAKQVDAHYRAGHGP